MHQEEFERSKNVLEVALPFRRRVLMLLGAWSCGRDRVVDGGEEYHYTRYR